MKGKSTNKLIVGYNSLIKIIMISGNFPFKPFPSGKADFLRIKTRSEDNEAMEGTKTGSGAETAEKDLI